MVHQTQKERQISGINPLFIERQDERALIGGQQIVGVFHPLGNTLEGMKRADIVSRQVGGEFVVTDVRINRHAYSLVPSPLTNAMSRLSSGTSRKARITGNISVSTAVSASSIARR